MTDLSSGRVRHRRVSFAAAAAGLLVCAGASADPPKAGDPAAAQALFYDARNLMHQGKYSEACPRLAESLRLDYGMGTEFNLADCNEKLGKLASAWAEFINVAAAAKAQNQPQREKLAGDRAAALEPRLPNLTVDVVNAAPELEVKRDGVLIGSASWHSPIPVDPGVHRITASAPGRQPWETTVNAIEAQPLRVEIPALAARATAAALPAEAPAPVAQPMPFPEPIVERGGTQRVVGWIVTAAGVAGLGVGLGFGVDSIVQRDQSRIHCTGSICDSEGLALRNRAITSGDVSTIATIAGGAVLLGGIALVMTAPRRSERRDAPGVVSLFAAPRVAQGGGGLSVGGAFQ